MRGCSLSSLPHVPYSCQSRKLHTCQYKNGRCLCVCLLHFGVCKIFWELMTYCPLLQCWTSCSFHLPSLYKPFAFSHSSPISIFTTGFAGGKPGFYPLLCPVHNTGAIEKVRLIHLVLIWLQILFMVSENSFACCICFLLYCTFSSAISCPFSKQANNIKKIRVSLVIGIFLIAFLSYPFLSHKIS